MLMLAVPSAKSRPFTGGTPSQHAVRMRSTWACANSATSPGAADARAITRRTRSATCSTVSPFGTGVAQMDQPGSSFWMSAVRRPS
jgi:hypothetical protein